MNLCNLAARIVVAVEVPVSQTRVEVVDPVVVWEGASGWIPRYWCPQWKTEM